jgi:hypothetical protein
MQITETSRPCAQAGQSLAGRPQPIQQVAPPGQVGDTTLAQATTLIQVYISDSSGLQAHGLLKSASRGGLQILTPISVPRQRAVEVTIAHCRAVLGEVFYCVKKSNAYQIGVVFSAGHKPKIGIGSGAIVNELEEPFRIAHGNVLDVGGSSLSILCKTMLEPGAWVRVEASGWILFGEVEGAIALSMVSCFVGVHLEVAFPAYPHTPVPLPQA